MFKLWRFKQTSYLGLAPAIMTTRRRNSRASSSVLQPRTLPNNNSVVNNMANVAIIGSTGMVVSFNHIPNPALEIPA